MATRALNRKAPPSADAYVAEPTPGQKLGRYELLVLIAVGGMAQVWLARQSGQHGFTKIVAVKIIRTDIASDPDFRAMFLDEARLSASIRHVNVVEVLDLGEQDGLVFQAMAFVEGATLQTLLSKARPTTAAPGLPSGIALRIVTDLLRGLHAAHELRSESGASLEIVHRDVSPQNVLVGNDGIAKLSDFGIAKALNRQSPTTQSGEVKGKLRYMAPEQMTAGEKETRRTDIFAAGVVLWETLTGRALFRVPPSLAEGRADRKVVPDPRTIVTTLPSEIAEVTLRALSEEPAERFATALEMADALEAAAERAGLPMSHKAVASFVTTALGKGDARHDLLVRAAEGATVTELQTTTIAVSQHSQPPPAPEHHARERQWPFVLAGMIACSIVIFLVRGSFEGSPAPAAPASTSAAAVTIAPPVEPTATTSPPASPPPATASAPRAPATQLPVPVPRKSKQRTQPTSAPTPATAAPPSTASSSPRAPFENPYL